MHYVQEKRNTRQCEPTFEALVRSPAANGKEHGEGGEEPSQHHCEGGAVIAVPVLAKDDPDDHQHERPQAVEQRGEEAQQRDIIGGEGPPPSQHLDCWHACYLEVSAKETLVVELAAGEKPSQGILVSSPCIPVLFERVAAFKSQKHKSVQSWSANGYSSVRACKSVGHTHRFVESPCVSRIFHE